MLSGTALAVMVLVIVVLWALPVVGTLALFPGASRDRCHGSVSNHG